MMISSMSENDRLHKYMYIEANWQKKGLSVHRQPILLEALTTAHFKLIDRSAGC